MLLFGQQLFAQYVGIQKPQHHSVYINRLTGARDSLYNRIMSEFDTYLQKHPYDIYTSIERCRFMEMAFYNEDEGYSLKYTDVERNLDSLLLIYPANPDLILYKSEFVYHDSTPAFCERVIERYNNDTSVWTEKGIGLIFNKYSVYLDKQDPEKALEYGLMAMRKNDTLDLSLHLARQYQALGRNRDAVELVLEWKDYSHSAWTLNGKGKLLLDLGEHDEALKLLYKASALDTNGYYSNDEELAMALKETGHYTEARVYLLKQCAHAYDLKKALITLLDFDLKHGPPDSALSVYRRLTDTAYVTDFMGIKRLRLFFKHPTARWTPTDIAKVLSLWLSFWVVLFLPLILVIPIYAAGHFFTKKGSVFDPGIFPWSLRHFWYISAVFLLCVYFIQLLFYYDEILNEGGDDTVGKVNITSAHSVVFMVVFLGLSVLFFFKRKDVALIWGSRWPRLKSVAVGVRDALSLRAGSLVLLYIYKLAGIDMFELAPGMCSITEEITSVYKYYTPIVGIVLVAFIVPVYEEIIFRGIFLSATEKYMPFFVANIFQAAVFAGAHQNLKLFPFFFAFGVLLGHERKQSGSLAPGIITHVINNFISCMALLFLYYKNY